VIRDEGEIVGKLWGSRSGGFLRIDDLLDVTGPDATVYELTRDSATTVVPSSASPQIDQVAWVCLVCGDGDGHLLDGDDLQNVTRLGLAMRGILHHLEGPH
jgi:hypothetical protein